MTEISDGFIGIIIIFGINIIICIASLLFKFSLYNIRRRRRIIIPLESSSISIVIKKETVEPIGEIPEHCVICLTNKCATIIKPCKHAILCLECTTNLIAKYKIECPYCRGSIEDFNLF